MFSIEKRFGDVNVLKEEFVCAKEKLVCVGFGVWVRITAGRETIDSHAFYLPVEKILRTITGHIGPGGEKLFGVATFFAPAGFKQNEHALGDECFVLAQIVNIDGMGRCEATEIDGDARAIEMAERKLVDTGKVREVVERRVDMGAGMRHEGTAFDGSAVHHGELLVFDRVWRLAWKLRSVIVVRLGEVVNHGTRSSPRIFPRLSA